MSALAATQIPKPANEQDFERACVPLWCDLLGDPNVQLNARRGQGQDGVDLFGMRNRDPKNYVGVQCKLKGDGKQLTDAEVRQEVTKALRFKPSLSEFFIVTTAPDDGAMHELARDLTSELLGKGRAMSVHVWGWGTLEQKISGSARARQAFDPTYSPYAESIRGEVIEFRQEDRELHSTTHAELAVMRAQLAQIIVSQAAGPADSTRVVEAVEVHLDAEIDNYRDLITRGQPKVALPLLEGLLARVRGGASGRILFRITANIGFCRLALGDDAAAAELMEEAHGHAPQEPKAAANRALGLLLQSRWKEVVSFGREKLQADPSNEALASYVLQAAHRDPESDCSLDLVPEELRSSAMVMVAWADVLRDREAPPAWWEVARAARAAHPGEDQARQLAAAADLDEVLRDGQFQRTRLLTPEERTRVEDVARVFRERWDVARAIDAPLQPEHLALCGNLALALFVLGDHGEALAVVRQGLGLVSGDADLVGRAVMIAIESGDDRLVQEFLPQLPDGPEATLLRLQDCLARQAWPEILDLLADHSDLVPETEQPLAQAAERLAALAVASKPVGEADLEPVVQFAATDARASVLVAGFASDRGLEQASEAAFQAALAALTEDGHIANRLMVAHLAEDRGKPRIVADLLLGHVDETHDSRHLRSLARALVNNMPIREGAVDFFARLPDSLRNHPVYVYGEGLLHLNRGALPEAEDCLRRAIAGSPNLIDRRLAMIAVLNRRGQGDLVKAVLDGLDLATAVGKPGEKMHVAQLLRQAGEGTKGMAYGYETLRAARNDPDATLRYLGLVLLLPEVDGSIPVVDAVSVDTWVALAGEDGTATSFVIEGAEHRASDGVVSPRHPLAAAALGRHVGDEFTVPAAFGNVRAWRVVEVKHKYLHAAHEVMATFEQRFPDARGFYTVHMREGDIEPALEQVRRASEGHRSLVDLYVEHHLPLNMVASRSGRDTIGFAEYVRLHGFTIQACVGVEQERLAADELISQRRAGGAVLDTYGAWTAASMDALDVVEGVFGSLQVARSTIDELLMLRDSFRLPPDGGSLLTVAWRNGQFFREEYTVEEVQARRTRVEEQIAKIERHCEVVPSAAPNDPSELAVELTEMFDETVLDAGILAARGRLLVSEDLHYRGLVEAAVGAHGVWLQAVFMFARQAGLIDQLRYAGLVSQLAARRHGHVAITTQDMLDELRLDDDAERWRIEALAEFIGTKDADLPSHLSVVQGFLAGSWTNGEPPLPVAKATGAVLQSLLRHRTNDWAWVLATLLASSRGPLRRYMEGWMRGHMILPHHLEAALQEFNARIGRARPGIEGRPPALPRGKSKGAKNRRRNKRRR